MRITITVPEVDVELYLDEVAQQIANGCLQGHVDSETYWDSVPDGAEDYEAVPPLADYMPRLEAQREALAADLDAALVHIPQVALLASDDAFEWADDDTELDGRV